MSGQLNTQPLLLTGRRQFGPNAGLDDSVNRTSRASAANRTKVSLSTFSVLWPNFDHKNTKSNAKILWGLMLHSVFLTLFWIREIHISLLGVPSRCACIINKIRFFVQSSATLLLQTCNKLVISLRLSNNLKMTLL